MTSQVDETFPPDQYSAALAAADRCARCEYELRGVADDQPCPECGLLAERSRGRATHLTDATPRWLLKIAVGTAVILLAHVLVVGWHFGLNYDYTLVRWYERNAPALIGSRVTISDFLQLGHDVAAITLLVGVWLLTSPQRRAGIAAKEDHLLRASLRVASVVPVVALALFHLLNQFPIGARMDWIHLAGFALLMIGTAPLPALGFIYLRRLAQRVLHPGLAEHAAIVGIGFSVSLLMTPPLSYAIQRTSGRWGPTSAWMFVLPLLLGVSLLLFSGWSALNCMRFIIAFLRAHRGAKRKWAAADRGAAE